MPRIVTLRDTYRSLHAEAERLAGGLNDLAQRAAVYHSLYEQSGGNHIFPLIAAHGALWAGGYFRFGAKIGECCSWQYFASTSRRQMRLQQLEEFANAFREINRLVCVETYTTYHFTAIHGDDESADQFVLRPLLEELNRCHAARRIGRPLTVAEKRRVFSAFFLNEQETVVGPRIQRAAQEFDWPLVRFIALRPLIRFAYFPGRTRILFRNFASRDERVKNGLLAFDTAANVGWARVESALQDYGILPDAFFVNSGRHFQALRRMVLRAA